MRKHSKIRSSVALLVVPFALAGSASNAAAVLIPNPELVALERQQATFLKGEMRHAATLKERALIHQELVLAYLDAVRDGG